MQVAAVPAKPLTCYSLQPEGVCLRASYDDDISRTTDLSLHYEKLYDDRAIV